MSDILYYDSKTTDLEGQMKFIVKLTKSPVQFPVRLESSPGGIELIFQSNSTVCPTIKNYGIGSSVGEALEDLIKKQKLENFTLIESQQSTHTGSSLDSFLEEKGLLEHCKDVAKERTLTFKEHE